MGVSWGGGNYSMRGNGGGRDGEKLLITLDVCFIHTYIYIYT